MKKIFEKIDELNEAYIKVWEDVCNIESPTHYKEGVDRVSSYFVKMAEERGWQVEYSRQEISGDAVCITLNPEVDAQPLSVSGHIDTVHPVGSFGTPAVHFEDNRICGPGTADCKGGVVAGFLAMDALYKCGYKKRPVQLLIQSDEEGSSMASNKTTIGYICKKAENAVAFLNMEPHSRTKVSIQRKGIVSFLVSVTGVEAHASGCATAGSNAIAEAAHKIIEIEKIKDDDGITCCCSVIEGGTAVNTVPGKCSFKVNVRFATKEQGEWIRKHMQEIADTVYVPGCKTEVSEITRRVAMELSEKNIKLLEKINTIFEKYDIPALEGIKRTSGSDAADVTTYGIPCVDSLGVCGNHTHNPNEYGVVSSLAESAKRIVAIAMEIE